MSDRELLLKAALGANGDRTPLLAYADWLMENGPPAAEGTAAFIWECCKTKSRRRLTAPAALDWLRANWLSLVPSVAAACADVPWGTDGRLDYENLARASPKPFGFGRG